MESELTYTARMAYQAYCKSSGNKNFRGDRCPEWEALPEAIRGHWEEAVKEVQRLLTDKLENLGENQLLSSDEIT